MDIFIRGFEARCAVEQDWAAHWTSVGLSAHVKRTPKMSQLRPGRSGETVQLERSGNAIRQHLKRTRLYKLAELYWSGRTKQKPTPGEIAVIEGNEVK